MWHIRNLNNTLKISAKCAKDIYSAQKDQGSEIWDDVDDVRDEDGLITFNCDHYEHMDYLHNEWVVSILKRHKAKGQVTFADVESGDGDFWGYQFDGKGGMTRLKGTLVWSGKPVKR